MCVSMLCLTVSGHSEEDATQETIDIERLSIEEAVELALVNSVEVRKTAVSIRDNETKLSEENTWNWLKPNLSLKGGFDMDSGQPRVGLGVGIDLKDIMGGGSKRIRSLNYSIHEGRKSLNSIKDSIRIKVSEAYKEYYLTKEKVKGTLETLKADQALLKKTQGTASNMEKLLLRSIINQDKSAQITAQMEFNRAEANLRELLGVSSVTPKEDIDKATSELRKLLESGNENNGTK